VDQRLIPADPVLVKQLMARAYLSAPAIDEILGDVVLQAHQVDAAARVLALLQAHGGAVLADATGMGKTFVALAVSRCLGQTTIIAPAALRRMWLDSLGRAGLRARVDSYEALSRTPILPPERPQLLVLDEAHHARNPASKRYVRLAELAWGTRVLILTATPIHNRGRDIRALLALFAGSRAESMSDDEVRQYIVRRTSASAGGSSMPALSPPQWLEVPRDPDTLRAIESLPPAVPAADGAPAHSLMILGLIRAWSSSEAALRETLRRRLRRVASYLAALECGRIPDRVELATWPVVDDAIQLGFPDLFPRPTATIDISTVQAALVRHEEGVRGVLRTIERGDGALDRARVEHLRAVQERHAGTPLVAFTQFADTARELFREMAFAGGAALVTGKGARIASGAVDVEEIVRGFDVFGRNRMAMPLHLLIATDVLSEGLSLRRAGVIVHLDVPWTLARLEQRVGRLRRMGSPHRTIAVYAIGPPARSHELAPVLRALQRKARIGTTTVGDGELSASLPLFGSRLRRATEQLVLRGDANANEELRKLLGRWHDPPPPAFVKTGACNSFALVLIRQGERHQLLVVHEDRVSDRIADVRDAVAALTATAFGATEPALSPKLASGLAIWLDEQRARELVRPATDAPSPAHVDTLRALQDILLRTQRAERSQLSARVERCRALVMSARGIGAEIAMSRLLRDGFDLDALDSLLTSGTTASSSGEDLPWVLAVLGSGTQGAFIAESMHQGPLQSSTHRAVPAAMQG
jgi:superfamily II DNA or RNA helicase